MGDIQFLLVTGMSGAGKTLALKAFEDMGVFCIDNLPPTFLTKLYELCLKGRGQERIAVVIDIRGGQFFDALFEELKKMEALGYRYQILFLEASNDVLVRRYKESRRRHPLAQEGRVLDGIIKERKKLEGLRGKANKIIDTSYLPHGQFKEDLQSQFFSFDSQERLSIAVISFGYKFGIPIDADLVMDVRFLPNPHYVPTLRPFTGDDPAVQEYVLRWPLTERFMKKFFELVLFLLPNYMNEGKTYLTIAIGCTGGRHRSVVISERLTAFLKEAGYGISLEHRDKLKSNI